MAAAVAAVVVLLGGCGDDPAGGGTGGGDGGAGGRDRIGTPTSTAERPAATFEADVAVDAGAVRVDYALTNDGDRPLLVVDRLPEPAGAGLRHPRGAAFVTEREPGAVLVSQALFGVPDTGMSWEALPRVGVTRLGAGETLTGRVRAPLAWRHPFGDDIGEGRERIEADVASVEFCLGVLPPPLHPSLSLGREGPVTTVAHAPAAEQYLFCTAPEPVAG